MSKIACLSIWMFSALAAFVCATAIGQDGPSSSSSLSSHIAGHVYRSDTNEPFRGAAVTIIGGRIPGVPFPEPLAMITLADGSYRFDDLMPGTYTVATNGGPFTLSAHTSVSLTAGQAMDTVDLKVDPSGIVSGIVVDKDGDPVEGVNVHVLYPGNPPKMVSFGAGPTNDQGAFRVGEVIPGKCLVVAEFGNTTAPGHFAVYYPGTQSLSDASTVSVKAGTDTTGIRIVLPDLGGTPPSKDAGEPLGGSISGVVSRWDSGAPIQKALVTLILKGSQTFAGRLKQTGSKGEYEFSGLAVGDYLLVFRAPGYMGPFAGGVSQEIHVDTQPLRNVDIKLRPAGIIAGVVSDADGSPVWLANVQIIRRDGTRQIRAGAAISDILGNFRAPVPSPGQYYLEVSTPQAVPSLGYVPTFFPDALTIDKAQMIEIGKDDVPRQFKITLPKAQTFTLTMKIKNFSGDPAAVYMFSVIQKSSLEPLLPGLNTRNVSRMQFAEAGSTMQFRGLLPGSYTASVTPADVNRDNSGKIVRASARGNAVSAVDTEINDGDQLVELNIPGTN